MAERALINVALIAPEIPHNTGNIIRLCANVGARLHLIEPLGFDLADSNLRRAALDYSDISDVVIHKSSPAFLVSKSNPCATFEGRVARRIFKASLAI